MRNVRYSALVLAGLIFGGIAGCGPTVNSQSRMDAPSPMSRQEPRRQEPRRQGMSTRNKVLLVAGAAALYYLYNKHKNREGNGPDGRYFRSKNGRVYYRDLKTGEYRWVDPPSQPIQVPAEEWERYTGRSADAYDGRVIREAPAGW